MDADELAKKMLQECVDMTVQLSGEAKELYDNAGGNLEGAIKCFGYMLHGCAEEHIQHPVGPGRMPIQTKEFQDKLKMLQAAVKIFQEKKDKESEAVARLAAADLYLARLDGDKATRELKRANTLYKSLREEPIKAMETQVNIDFLAALSAQLMPNAEMGSEKAKATVADMVKSRMDKAIQTAEGVVAACDDGSHAKKKAVLKVAYLYLTKGEEGFDKAIELAREMEEMYSEKRKRREESGETDEAEELEDKRGEADAMTMQCNILQAKGESDKAMQLSQSMAMLFKDEDAERAVRLETVAELHRVREEWDATQFAYNLQLGLYRDKLMNKKGQLQAMMNMVATELKKDDPDYDQGIKMCRDALDIAKEIDDKHWQAVAYHKIASCQLDKIYYTIEDQMFEALKEVGRLGLPPQAAKRDWKGGMLKAVTECMAILEKSAEMFKDLGDEVGVVAVYETIHEFYKHASQFHTATTPPDRTIMSMGESYDVWEIPREKPKTVKAK